jgi:hypothetical protein
MEDLVAKVASAGFVVVAAWKAGIASIPWRHQALFAAGPPPAEWLPDPNVIQTWGALLIGGTIYAWNEWRKSQRAAEEDKLLAEQRNLAHRTLKKIHKANDLAIDEGRPVPFPDFLPDADDDKDDGK